MAWTTPKTDFDPGDILLSSEMNDIGNNLTELAPFFSAWTSYTPTLTQSSAVTKTVDYASYLQIGQLVIASLRLSVTGAGTGGNSVTVGLPVTAASTLIYVGSGAVFDSSTSTNYVGTWLSLTTTTAILVGDWSGQNAWGSTPSIALASGDSIRGYLMYEAA